ncbi:MAG: hypothetical protein GXP30_11800 [Verrucomicrobia bacterium]|nr:hypothetical protein [Verrucomicrobiota bacterium]
MKKQHNTLLSLMAVVAACAAFAANTSSARADEKDHGHSHEKKVAGPNGGRLITSVKPRLEFFVTKDRKVKITAVDDHNNVIPLAEQSVKVSGGSRFKPVRLKFEKKDGALISTKPFPEGKKLPVIVQIKTTSDSKTVTEKFYLDQNKCPECKNEEYACICDHDH